MATRTVLDMRKPATAVPFAILLLLLGASAAGASKLNGTVKLGGVFLDETGDRSAVQETFDVYDGFAVSQVQLEGSLNPRSFFTLDLRDLNFDSRAGDMTYRLPGVFKMRAGFDQSRYVFDPGGGVTSDRKDWKVGMQYTPRPGLVLSGDLDRVARDGDRLAYPLGTLSAFGTGYDNTFLNAQVGADVHRDRVGGGVSYRHSDYQDALNGGADRKGNVVSGRLYSPMPFWAKWNNLFRGSCGTRNVSDGGVEYKLSSFQYTSVVQPVSAYEVRYAFEASRVQDDAADLRTDRVTNDFDVTWYHAYGRLNAGYGYETNDDDLRLTSYHSWRAGMTFRPDPRLRTKVEYSGRVKKDQEELTLLKDTQALKFRANVDYRPWEHLSIVGDFTRREREFPDIAVSAEGSIAGAVVRYDLPKWGAVTADYSHAIDEYNDRVAGFETETDMVTARLDFERVRNVHLGGGLTYLDIGRDLDIEKVVVTLEGSVKVAGRYHLEAKYNAYNYDDYILLDRYYTANVVRVNLGYDLRP